MADPLRIVTFNVLPQAYQLVADWAEARGHRIVLLVTTPSAPDGRYGPTFRPLVNVVPPTQDVLVTTRLRKTATPVVAALQPDLIISATFPLRIPPSLVAIPRYGAVNLHPAPLPRGRGPNPLRLVYEGDTSVSAALHRIEPGFDAGAILSLQTRQLSDDFTAEMLMPILGELLFAALDEGVARAVAGEYGDVQDESLASYPGPFTDEDLVLRWDEPARTIQRRGAALNMLGPIARGIIDGVAQIVVDVRALPGKAPTAAPGTILAREGDIFIIRAADGAVQVRVGAEEA